MISPPKLIKSYANYSLKQHSTVEHLGYYLDSNLNGEPMVCRVLKKINNKCIRFCLELPPRGHTKLSHFRK